MQNASRGRAVYPVAPIPARGEKVTPPKKMVVAVAKAALGTPYVPGGTDLNGFDCSGFVRWTYSHFGIKLPRSASEQARMGYSVRRDNLQAGDIVTFRDSRRGWNHVGIYVGDGKFIHSPRRNKNVVIVSMDQDYFRRTYTGARRLSTDIDDERLSEVEDLIADYKQEYSQRRNRPRRSQEKAIAATTRSNKEKASASTSRRSRDKDTATASRSSRNKESATNARRNRDKNSATASRNQKKENTASRNRPEANKQVKASLTKDRTEKAKSRDKARANRQEKASRDKAAATNKEKARATNTKEKARNEKQRATSSKEQAKKEKARSKNKEKQQSARSKEK